MKSFAALRDRGASLFSISPQTAANNLALREKLNLNFEILTDVGNSYAQQLDLRHGFSPELKEIYLQLGADLEKSNGDSSWTLPVPARIIVNADHAIQTIEYHADYKRRPEPSGLVGLL